MRSRKRAPHRQTQKRTQTKGDREKSDQGRKGEESPEEKRMGGGEMGRRELWDASPTFTSGREEEKSCIISSSAPLLFLHREKVGSLLEPSSPTPPSDAARDRQQYFLRRAHPSSLSPLFSRGRFHPLLLIYFHTDGGRTLLLLLLIPLPPSPLLALSPFLHSTELNNLPSPLSAVGAKYPP